MSIVKIINEVADEICDKYCKWPDKWNAEEEGEELSESDICRNCPLSRLSEVAYEIR